MGITEAKADFEEKWPVHVTQQDNSRVRNSSQNPRSTALSHLVSCTTLPMLWGGTRWSSQSLLRETVLWFYDLSHLQNSFKKSLGMPAHPHIQEHVAGNNTGSWELPQLAIPAAERWKFSPSTQALLESIWPVERVTTAPCTSSRAQHHRRTLLFHRTAETHPLWIYLVLIAFVLRPTPGSSK